MEYKRIYLFFSRKFVMAQKILKYLLTILSVISENFTPVLTFRFNQCCEKHLYSVKSLVYFVVMATQATADSNANKTICYRVRRTGLT